MTDAGAVTGDPSLVDTTTVRVLAASGVAPPFNVAVFDVTFAPTVTPVVVEASFDARDAEAQQAGRVPDRSDPPLDRGSQVRGVRPRR